MFPSWATWKNSRISSRNASEKVDILINSAGFTPTKPAWEITEAEWDQTMDISFKGTFFLLSNPRIDHAPESIRKNHNLSSTFARSSITGRSIYSAYKAGISRLTEVLATEWAPDGIRVNAIAPTAVKTPTRAELLKGDVLKNVLSRIPLGRLATPEDLIGATIFLASPASDFVTGQTLFVDGGWVAAR